MGELSLFYLLHTKITMNIIEMAVQINGVRINEGPLYSTQLATCASVISQCLRGVHVLREALVGLSKWVQIPLMM